MSVWHGINCPFCGQLHAGLPCPSVKGSREVWYPVHHYHGGGEWENTHTAPVSIVTDEQAEIIAPRAKLKAAGATIEKKESEIQQRLHEIGLTYKVQMDLKSRAEAAEAEAKELQSELKNWTENGFQYDWEQECIRLHAEVARLREALERIANNHWTSSAAESMRSIARAALELEESK